MSMRLSILLLAALPSLAAAQAPVPSDIHPVTLSRLSPVTPGDLDEEGLADVDLCRGGGESRLIDACARGIVEIRRVVDFDVEDDPDCAVFVRDRLVAALEVDDAEAAHADGDAVADVHALLVGPAVHERPRHPLGPVEQLALAAARPLEQPRDSAHR